MFDGLDDGEGLGGIGGVDPYQIRDLQSGLGGPSIFDTMKTSSAEGEPPPNTPVAPSGKTTWQETVATGLKTAGELFKTQAQVQQADTMTKLNQMLSQGQITQQAYQLQVEELRRRAAVLAAQQSQTPGWFEKNKTLVIIAGLLIAAGVGFYFWQRRR